MTKTDIYAHLTDILRDEFRGGGVIRGGLIARRLRQLADRIADDIRATPSRKAPCPYCGDRCILDDSPERGDLAALDDREPPQHLLQPQYRGDPPR